LASAERSRLAEAHDVAFRCTNRHARKEISRQQGRAGENEVSAFHEVPSVVRGFAYRVARTLRLADAEADVSTVFGAFLHDLETALQTDTFVQPVAQVPGFVASRSGLREILPVKVVHRLCLRIDTTE
jgi:hypothetical protein